MGIKLEEKFAVSDLIPTFRERFAEIYQVLEDFGYAPQWQSVAKDRTWHPKPYATFDGSDTVEIIRCTIGPILAIELRCETIVTQTQTEVQDNKWRTDTEVWFQVRADWPKRWVQVYIGCQSSWMLAGIGSEMTWVSELLSS